MTTLKPQDLQWVLQRIPRHVLAAIKDSKGNVFVAGGFIRACIANEPPADIDLFANNKFTAIGLAEQLALVFRVDPRRGHDDKARYHETDNAYTITEGYKTPIQIIHRWTFDKPEKCIKSFDFTIARVMVWSDGENWKSLCDDDFYSDLAAKRLVYKSPVREEEAGGSMLRVLKFYQRGYRIPLDSLGAVIARLCEKVNIPVSQPPVPEGYREREVAKVITGLLREVDPSIDPDHIAHLPETKDA